MDDNDVTSVRTGMKNFINYNWILFNDHHIFEYNFSRAGRSYTRGACQNTAEAIRSIAIVRGRGVFDGVETAVHELVGTCKYKLFIIIIFNTSLLHSNRGKNYYYNFKNWYNIDLALITLTIALLRWKCHVRTEGTRTKHIWLGRL